MSKINAKVIWVIRAGKGGQAHDLFLGGGVIALADAGLGDLSQVNATRDSFYSAYRKLHPEDTRVGSAGIAGKFFRFANEIHVGDLVLYPSSRDKMVYIGKVLDDYTFNKSCLTGFPHQRAVKWKYLMPKSEFSQSARDELGAARTFFKYKAHADAVKVMIDDGKLARFRSQVKTKAK